MNKNMFRRSNSTMKENESFDDNFPINRKKKKRK